MMLNRTLIQANFYYSEEARPFMDKVSASLGAAVNPYEVTAAVLHSLRARISPTQSLLLLSEIPLFLKAIFTEGWKLHERPRNSNDFEDLLNELRERNRLATRRLSAKLNGVDKLKEFLGDVKQKYYTYSGKRIESDLIALQSAKAIINTIAEQTNHEVIHALAYTLPRELATLFTSAVSKATEGSRSS